MGKIIVNFLEEDLPSNAKLELWKKDSGYSLLFWKMNIPNPSVMEKFYFMFDLAYKSLEVPNVKVLFATSKSEYIPSSAFENDFGFKMSVVNFEPYEAEYKVFGFGSLNLDLTREILFRFITYIDSELLLGGQRGEDFINETLDQIMNEYLRSYENIRI